MIGYKVVSYYENRYRYYSANYSVVEYELHKKTVPVSGEGPLCLFANIKDASDFKKWFEEFGVESFRIADKYFKIFKAEYQPSTGDKVWLDYYGVTIVTPIGNLRDGTVLAESITLLEEVV